MDNLTNLCSDNNGMDFDVILINFCIGINFFLERMNDLSVFSWTKKNYIYILLSIDFSEEDGEERKVAVATEEVWKPHSSMSAI